MFPLTQLSVCVLVGHRRNPFSAHAQKDAPTVLIHTEYSGLGRVYLFIFGQTVITSAMVVSQIIDSNCPALAQRLHAGLSKFGSLHMLKSCALSCSRNNTVERVLLS